MDTQQCYVPGIPVLDGMRYFYSKTDECNFFPRLEITMTEPVNLDALQIAAERTMARYRVFRLVPVHDQQRFYLVDNKKKPIVHVYDGQRRTVGAQENNGHLTWIGADNCKIIFEFFHGVSDIHGAIPFMKMLLQEYCGVKYENGDTSADNGFESELISDEEECRDSLQFIDENQKSVAEKRIRGRAYQLTDEQLELGPVCFSYELDVDAEKFDAYMRKHESSRTAVFALWMSRAIADSTALGEAQVVAGVAADVRKIYGVEGTMRDCTDILAIPFTQEIREMPVSAQLKCFREMIFEDMEPKKRLAVAAEIKKNNVMMEKRMPSFEGKKAFCEKVHQYSYANYTYNISNVGKVSFGEETDRYVVSVKSAMCANTFPIILEIVQFGQKYHIVYCTRLKNDPYVRRFQQSFVEQGIPCTCEMREDHVEPYAVFTAHQGTT